jgi:hypothetical protein
VLQPHVINSKGLKSKLPEGGVCDKRITYSSSDLETSPRRAVKDTSCSSISLESDLFSPVGISTKVEQLVLITPPEIGFLCGIAHNLDSHKALSPE